MKTAASRDDLKTVLIQVAHKQIIQQPTYALDNMSAVAAQSLKTTSTTTAKIHTMYEKEKNYFQKSPKADWGKSSDTS